MIAANVAVFLYAPIYCSYKSIREAETELVDIRDDLGRLAEAGDTVIVGFDSHFLSYRHAAYYLPRFLTVQYPALRYPEGDRVFAVENRSTMLLKALPADPIKQFVFFPLPAGQAYSRYLQDVRNRFPAGALTSTVVNGREYFRGSSLDLRVLFPGLVSSKVYTGSYTAK